jgi:hypothetical protein
MPATLRAFPPPTRRFRGAPRRATRILRVLFRRAMLRSRLSTDCGPGGPAALPGPLCGGETGTTGRVAGVDTDVDSFSPGQEALSKSPAPAHGLAGQEPGKRQAGYSFSLVTFSLSTQRESDSGANGARKLFAPEAKRKTRAPPTSGLHNIPTTSRSFLFFQPRHQLLQHGLRLRVEERIGEVFQRQRIQVGVSRSEVGSRQRAGGEHRVRRQRQQFA